MNLDLILLGVLALFGVLGVFSGAVKQLSHWFGVGLGYGFADGLSSRFTPWAAAHTGLRPMMVRVGLSVLIFPLLYLCGAAAVQGLFQLLIPDRRKDFLDKTGGFVLGAGKAGAIAFALLSAVIFYEKPLSSVYAGFDRDTQGSKAIAFVRAHNLFAVVHLPALGGMEKLLDAAKDPASARALAKDSNFQALMNDPRLKDLLNDKNLSEALKSGDASAVAASAKLKELLKDSKAAERLSALEK